MTPVPPPCSAGVLRGAARGRELELGVGDQHAAGPPGGLPGAAAQTHVRQPPRAARADHPRPARQVRIRSRTHARMHTLTRMHAQTHRLTNTHTHTRTHEHTNSHTHTRTHACTHPQYAIAKYAPEKQFDLRNFMINIDIIIYCVNKKISLY